MRGSIQGLWEGAEVLSRQSQLSLRCLNDLSVRGEGVHEALEVEVELLLKRLHGRERQRSTLGRQGNRRRGDLQGLRPRLKTVGRGGGELG